MMNCTDLMKEEVIKRVKALHLEELAEKDIIQNGTFWISERTGWPWNVNYFLDGYSYEKEVQKCIDILKSNNMGIPYFAIVDHLRDGGLLISILCVSNDSENWDVERLDENGSIEAWVFNTELGYSPEYGCIQIKSSMGGVRRTA